MLEAQNIGLRRRIVVLYLYISDPSLAPSPLSFAPCRPLSCVGPCRCDERRRAGGFSPPLRLGSGRGSRQIRYAAPLDRGAQRAMVVVKGALLRRQRIVGGLRNGQIVELSVEDSKDSRLYGAFYRRRHRLPRPPRLRKLPRASDDLVRRRRTHVHQIQAFLALSLFFASLYFLVAKGAFSSPLFRWDREQKVSFSSQMPGALAASAGWIASSFVYSLWFRTFPRFSYLYGSLAAVVFFMLWIYSCIFALLLGAELNKICVR